MKSSALADDAASLISSSLAFQSPVGDVVAYGACEQVRLLAYQGQLLSQPHQIKLPDVNAIQKHLQAAGIQIQSCLCLWMVVSVCV